MLFRRVSAFANGTFRVVAISLKVPLHTSWTTSRSRDDNLVTCLRQDSRYARLKPSIIRSGTRELKIVFCRCICLHGCHQILAWVGLKNPPANIRLQTVADHVLGVHGSQY
jgi:hypothetical protein